MRVSKCFWCTKKELPSEEENDISKLLIKAGYVCKNSSGIYTYLPLGVKLLENMKKIIDEECEKIDASKVLFPSLVQDLTFKISERNVLFGDSMFFLKDRNNKGYNLCPTHEELFAMLASSKINSYKDLHFILYQISNKFRDEVKTNRGITRKKEFSMFDAYSFDVDESGLDISYDNMYQVFRKIFRRYGLDTVVAESNPGDMKAYLSEEFHVIGDFGEDEIVKCTKCSYVSNTDIAEVIPERRYKDKKVEKLKLVATPSVKTVKDLCEFLDIKEKQVLKSMIYRVHDSYKMIVICGDAKINENKLIRALGTKDFELASEEEIRKIGSVSGFIGPLKSTMEIIADNSVKNMSNFVCGANKEGHHYVNVSIPFDFTVSRYADLKQFDERCNCPKCGGKAEIIKGLEIGNIFKLGGSFSKKLDVVYTNEKNEKHYVYMGSYGIGLDRCIYAIAQKYHDDNGFMFPMEVAPYKVAIVIANVNDKEARDYAESLYKKLITEGIDVILDDRKEGLGVKLNDMDLVGVPIRITVGKMLVFDKLELKLRNEDNVDIINKDEIVSKVKEIVLL